MRAIAVACALIAAFTLPAFAGDAARGQETFKACAACHGDRPGDLGPSLIGVVGRVAGTREDFRYSGPMARAGFVWDEAHLGAFIHNPRSVVAGTRMPFDGLADDRDVEDVVAYLASRK